MGKLELVEELKGHEDRVWNVSWSPNGQSLATCGEDKRILLWSKDLLGKWSCNTKLTEGHKRTIREVNWSPCGKNIGKSTNTSVIAF